MHLIRWLNFDELDFLRSRDLPVDYSWFIIVVFKVAAVCSRLNCSQYSNRVAAFEDTACKTGGLLV
ncbi:hypothetical protein SAY86_026313 [Trapa natans]|uniref:Uncharacterized protein n=1 Tax=Trapa natans TaxID=22666 RepID=A0AAN7KAN3_TRANT|nr:hypothetical protein SAY86_026313 [Trapa natans]